MTRILQTAFYVLALSFSLFSQPINYTTPGTYTWTVPPCVYEITVKVWGGGGGGGGALAIMKNSSSGGETCSGGAGGGGGGFTSKTFSVTPGQTYTVVVGAGGTAGIAGAGSWSGGITTLAGNGGTGGTSSFTGNGQNLNATGGIGGGGASGYNTTTSAVDLNTVGTGGAGGVGSGGSSNFTGGAGGSGYIPGNFSNDFSGPGGGAAGPGGNGGSNTPPYAGVADPAAGVGQAPGGNGAKGRYNNQPGKQEKAGYNGLTYGGGGGGAVAHIDPYNVAKAAGGAGANGAVIIEYTSSGSPTPTPVITLTAATCSADGTVKISNYSASNSYSFTPSGPTVGAGGVISGMVAGTTYTVTATASGSCESSASSSFSLSPQLTPPTVTVSPNATICSGNSATLTAGGADTYVWSPTTNLSSSTGSSVIASPTTTTTYTVTGTASNGCTNSAQVTITVTPPPTANAGNDVTTPCGIGVQIGETTSTTVSPMAPAGCSGASQMIVNPAGGAYINSVSTTGGLTTNISNLNTLVDGNNPQTDYIAFNRWYSNFTNHLVDANQGGSFQLNLQGNKGATGSNPPTFSFRVWIDWNNDGNFDNIPGSELVHTTATTASNPFNFNNITINVPSNAAIATVRMRIRVKYGAEFVASDASCTKSNPNGWPGQGNYDHTSEVEDYSVQIYPAGGGGGNSNYTYSWTPTTGLDDPTISNPTATPSSTTTYYVTVTDTQTGCTATDSVVVTVNQPSPIFNPIAPFCAGTTAPTLPTTSTNGIAGTWNPAVVSNTNSGSYTFTPNVGTCASDTTIQIVVNPATETPIISTTPATCTDQGSSSITNYSAGNTYTFSPTGPTIAANGAISGMTIGTAYTLIASNGSCPSNPSNPFTNDDVLSAATSPTVATTAASCLSAGTASINNYSASNNYVFTPPGPTVGLDGVINNMTYDQNYTVAIDNGGCSSGESDPFSISGQLTNPPTPIVSVIDPTCTENGSATISNYNANYLYNFSPAGPTVSSAGLISNVTFGQSYTVVADGGGCISQPSNGFTVSEMLTNPVLTVSNDVTICAGANTTISANGANTYNWDNGFIGSTQVVSPSATTTYTVVGTNSNGCSASESVTVTVVDAMNLSISVNASKGCGPVTAQFSSNATSPIQLTWDFGDGTTSNAYNPTHIYNSENCYAVTLTADNGLGCITTVSLNDSICVYAQPNASFWATPATIENYPYEVQVNNNSTNATNYTWYFGDDTAPSHSFEPSHTYASDASGGFTIMLVASNAIGCVDTAYYGVKIIEDLIFYVPNSFTPDGDQFNNTFKPVFTAGFDKYNYEMIIYNRWGEKVFQTHNTEIGWDGTYNGKMVQDGTYTWKIIVKVSDYDEHKQFVGHVNMIR